ncbi:hypothetical protein [Dactylosporangium salmoneum]|uniref:hypothetical protein n=1 Tax=Dactylosporangium salmoneum TaxID=53361 RepID=UPI0031DCD0F6
MRATSDDLRRSTAARPTGSSVPGSPRRPGTRVAGVDVRRQGVAGVTSFEVRRPAAAGVAGVEVRRPAVAGVAGVEVRRPAVAGVAGVEVRRPAVARAVGGGVRGLVTWGGVPVSGGGESIPAARPGESG